MTESEEGATDSMVGLPESFRVLARFHLQLKEGGGSPKKDF